MLKTDESRSFTLLFILLPIVLVMLIVVAFLCYLRQKNNVERLDKVNSEGNEEQSYPNRPTTDFDSANTMQAATSLNSKGAAKIAMFDDQMGDITAASNLGVEAKPG